MKKTDNSRFIKILETDSLTDIALIKSVLDSEEINYFIQGENLKFIRPGDQPACLMVPEYDVDRVLEILKPIELKHVHNIFRLRS